LEEDKILQQFPIDSMLVQFKNKSANMEIQFREAEKKAC